MLRRPIRRQIGHGLGNGTELFHQRPTVFWRFERLDSNFGAISPACFRRQFDDTAFNCSSETHKLFGLHWDIIAEMTEMQLSLFLGCAGNPTSDDEAALSYRSWFGWFLHPPSPQP